MKLAEAEVARETRLRWRAIIRESCAAKCRCTITKSCVAFAVIVTTWCPAFAACTRTKTRVVDAAREDDAAGRVQTSRADQFCSQSTARRSLPAADWRQPGQADGCGRRGQTDRPNGTVAADLSARLRQDDADGVRRQSTGDRLHEDQWPGDRPRGDVARSGRGTQRGGPRRDRAIESRPRDGRQRDAVSR